MRRLSTAALVIAALVAVAPAPAAAAPQSRVEYGVEVGLICAEAEDEYLKAGKGLFKRKGLGNFAPFFDRFLDVYEDTIEKVAVVPAAAGDEALVAAWIQELRRSARLANRVIPILKRSYRVLKRADGEKTKRYRALNRRAGRRFKKADRAVEEAGDLAKELTAEGCAVPGAP